MKFWCLQISQKNNQILDRFLTYEARAEICQKFVWLLGRFKDTKISFWDWLTFKVLIQVRRTFWPQAVIWPGVNHYRLPFFNFGNICSLFFTIYCIVYDFWYKISRNEISIFFFECLHISNLRLTFEDHGQHDFTFQFPTDLSKVHFLV